MLLNVRHPALDVRTFLGLIFQENSQIFLVTKTGPKDNIDFSVGCATKNAGENIVHHQADDNH